MRFVSIKHIFKTYFIMTSKLLTINPMYSVLEDGRLYNRTRGRFVKASVHSKAKPNFLQYDILNIETGKREKIAKHRLKEFVFGNHTAKKISDLPKMKIIP